MDIDFLEMWLAFLNVTRKRFKIAGGLGAEWQSNCGFPQGEGLSVVAMLFTANVWHIRMEDLAPRATAYSWADNLEWTAARATDVALGLSCFRTAY